MARGVELETCLTLRGFQATNANRSRPLRPLPYSHFRRGRSWSAWGPVGTFQQDPNATRPPHGREPKSMMSANSEVDGIFAENTRGGKGGLSGKEGDDGGGGKQETEVVNSNNI